MPERPLRSEPAKPPPWTLGTFVSRFFIGHFITWIPLALWAFGGISWAVLSVPKAVLLDMNQDAATKLILVRHLVVTATLGALHHVAIVPWAMARDESAAARRKRVFVWITVALSALCLLLGGGGWVYLMTRPA